MQELITKEWSSSYLEQCLYSIYVCMIKHTASA